MKDKGRLKGLLALILAAVIAMPVTSFAQNEGTYMPELKTSSYNINFSDANYRTLKNRSISLKNKKLNINLRTLIKEGNSGYSVVQGGCTDGKYAYYLMVSTKTQRGRVLKVKLKNNKVVKRSKVLNTYHGNGMAYDSKRNRLVVIARGKRKQEITVIDAKTLKITKQKDAQYSYYKGAGADSIRPAHQNQGLAAIAYVKKFDCYICLERVYHNLLFIDPDTFQTVGMAFTNITDNYPGTFQAMDADEKYVYLLLSKYTDDTTAQPYNLILAIDYNGENLLPVVNGTVTHIDKSWYCNNDGGGRQDAAIRLKTNYEAENIYHTIKSGKEYFYLTAYRSKPVYKKMTRRLNGKNKRIKRLSYIKRYGYVYKIGVL